MLAAVVAGLLLPILFAALAQAETPGMIASSPLNPVPIFEARSIITMEPAQPRARFVAVADGIILGVADSVAALEPWTRGRQVTLDRRHAGAVLMPGFVEPHIHPMQAAVMLNLPFIAPDDWRLPSGNWPGARTPEAYRARLREELARAPADRPFITWGHHVLFHGSIDRAALDAIAPDRPLVVWQRSFHEVIMNSAALRHYGMADAAAFAARLAAHNADPAHGDHARGILSETALPVALEALRPDILRPQQIEHGMGDLARIFTARGITTASDMGTGVFADFDAEALLITRQFGRDDSATRINLMPIGGRTGDDAALWLAARQQRWQGHNVSVNRRIKFFADGAFFAQNMMMNAPGYADGHHGKWIMEPAVLETLIPRYWAQGFDLHIHVNGDAGLDEVLAIAEGLPPRGGQTITLEHLGYSTEAQNRRIARAGLMVSAQPNYIRVLAEAYAREGLGPDRAGAMNRLGSLEAKAVPLGLHSDFNMAPIDPLYLAWIAANRITLAGNRPAPAERISLDKAMRAITIEAAQVIGMDAQIGSIAAGKKADFVVLGDDPWRMGVARLKDVPVRGVIFEGRFTPAQPSTAP